MQEDFHYYATYCAAFLAGYTHEESTEIAYSAQMVDCCSKTLLQKLHAPLHAATTQLQLEMMNHRTDIIGLQEITRIWASFHFLPKDLSSECRTKSKLYKDKYHLICGPNGDLVKESVILAKDKDLQAVGIAMHVLADTWAHRYFVGTPSLVMNNIASDVIEVISETEERPVLFNHNVKTPDDTNRSYYTNTMFQLSENSVMNLGHGRAGHLPDYSYIHYKYMPAWADYEMVHKDNPEEYYLAFGQMVYAMQFIRGDRETFELKEYALDTVGPYAEEIKNILKKRQLIASDDWKEFGEKLSGKGIEPFSINKYQEEYISADKEEKDNTGFGKFIVAALAQKSMVTNRIFKTRNLLAGYSVNYFQSGFKGIKDFFKLVEKEVGAEK